ncbi:MAG TPA: exodeoxyribonuclease V subunit gamma [Ramlibacter sp.]|uniref:exodeoxyribonuclease V subunit gamma n=1 Tax=Ramlibacter sp. TaxID=1917967 RepID=UPI002CFC672B|nr:exodeoxyribonuclease V subunit gamma [Ramlibacter sp.]HVZ46877.1 exodeoxyribonuclease V subunit gamma [Ramlibacter sp.]
MFHAHFSNRFEPLAALLTAQLATPREDVFAADEIVVAGSAMRRALSLAIAERESVCANVRFSFLAQWLWTQVSRLVSGVEPESPFDSDSLTWRIYAAFGDSAFVASHTRLASYLAAARGDEVMRYELAARTARLFEQYVTYRPDWLVRWQRGERVPPRAGHDGDFTADEAWQGALWQRIARDLNLVAEHPLQLMARRLEAGGTALARSAGVPDAVHVFAPPAMAPLHLQGLQALGRCIDVHVYAINPCREYWFDVVSPKALAELDAAGRAQARDEGNRLLASWGGQAQASLALLRGACDEEGVGTTELFVEVGEATLLARVQNAILALEELPAHSVDKPEADRSIEVHVCHSLTRELEVLHDHLLARFAADRALQPSDVLVVTPDLDRAAPLVDAVFGTAPAARRIPYAITGRAGSRVNPSVRAFSQLMRLAASRCPATEVFALLQQPSVARRFDLDDDSLGQVRDWMLAAGMNWGLDVEHLARLGLPVGSAHTLADGLERLYLGYALPDEVSQPFDGRLPRGAPEGSGAMALGAFRRYIDGLRALRAQLWRARPGAEWAAYLHELADEFIAPAREAIEDHLELHRAIDALAQGFVRGGFTGDVDASVLRAALDRVLDDPARGGVPTGRVTFASASSLRNLPFRIVCAVGFGDTAFPNADRPIEFDLMADAPRTGDRQRGQDQRTLFLDLLLAARSQFYLSYTGRSIRDNSVLPPSVLIAELLDAIVPAIVPAIMPAIAAEASPESMKAARDALVVEHPLQPFSPVAFDEGADERVRSFDAELAAALRESVTHGVQLRANRAALADDEDDEADREPAVAFFASPLPAPGDEWREVAARSLVDFFRNPSRYVLRRRLKLDVPGEEAELEDDEPFVPTRFAAGAMAQRLLPALLRGESADAVRALAEAGVELPPGSLGDAERDSELAQLQGFAQRVLAASAGEVLPPHEARVALDVEGERWVVHTGFADLRAQGAIRFYYGEESAFDVIAAGIDHLLLCANPPEGVRPALIWFCRDGKRVFDPIAPKEAREKLTLLITYYRMGLSGPVPFAAKTSWALLQEGDYRALQTWGGRMGRFGERTRPGYALAFRGRPEPPDDPWFASMATDVFTALGGRRVAYVAEVA